MELRSTTVDLVSKSPLRMRAKLLLGVGSLDLFVVLRAARWR